MKKFILISSLLAAGTLAASATTTISVASSLFSSYTAGATSATGTTFYADLLGTSNQWKSGQTTTTSVFYSSCTNYAPVYNFLVSSQNAGTWFYDTSNGSSVDNGNQPTVQVASDGSATIARIQGTGQSQTLTAGWGVISASELQKVSSLSLSYTASGSTSESYPIDIAIFYIVNGSTFYRVALETISSTGSGTIDLDLTGTGLVLGEEAAASATIAVAIRSNAVSADSDKWKATTLSGVQFVGTAIPEPSFFGLLAGTLALGLAGTRRRRRAK